ncbi:hypothetical protein [Leucobacter insecticola]|nr:hypothetical protein [Leucobacter insecticola]
MLAGAIELTEAGKARARLQVLRHGSAAEMADFVRMISVPGCEIVTVGSALFPEEFEGHSREHLEFDPASRKPRHLVSSVYRLFPIVRQHFSTIYNADVDIEQIQEKFDDFSFRFNIRNVQNRGLVFMVLLQKAIAVPPVTYRDLVRDRVSTKRETRVASAEFDEPICDLTEAQTFPWRREA